MCLAHRTRPFEKGNTIMSLDPEQEQETNLDEENDSSLSAEHELTGGIEDAMRTGEASSAHTIKVGSAG